MVAFAFYRLPYLHHATRLVQREGEPEILSSVAELNGKEGFVIAPFVPSSDCPVLLLHPEEISHLAVKKEDGGASLAKTSCREEELGQYAQDFEYFHRELERGLLRKIVLARCADEKGSAMDENEKFHLGQTLFMKACSMYPRLFVALVYTPQSGLWLMATPETLLKGDGGDFYTMSLAGTQRAEPSRVIADYPIEGVEWSEKNLAEQQYVTDYIEQCVSSFTDDWSVKGPYTTMAANLYHLRTDIRFRLTDTDHLGDVLEKLYPTPAVCGIPKETARQFILEHEHLSRKYYSGFVGILSPEGKSHLFVSLRCANLLDNGRWRLYAGGGLLKESVMLKEWEETEAKMQTIKNVLNV